MLLLKVFYSVFFTQYKWPCDKIETTLPLSWNFELSFFLPVLNAAIS